MRRHAEYDLYTEPACEWGGEAGHALEDRNRTQLYELAKHRSKMDKSELIRAIRSAG